MSPATGPLEEAVALFREGRAAQAESSLRRLPEPQLAAPRAAHLMALVVGAQGRAGEALAWIERAIAAGGAGAALLETRAQALHDLARDAQAREDLRAALAAQPRSASGWTLLARVLAMLGDAAGAAQAVERAASLGADAAEAYHRIALELHGAGRGDEAMAAYRAVLASQPDNAEAHGNLGFLLVEGDRVDEALAHCRRAVQLRPSSALAHNNLGLALHKAGRLEEAGACYRRALEIDPGFEKAARNLAYLALDLGDTAAAIERYRRLLEAHPESGSIAYDLGLACLCDFRFEEGWRLCERRFEADAAMGARRPAGIAPLAEGERPEDHRVGLWMEQGIGDQILFSTLLPDLARRGGRFVLEADPRLLAALRRSHPDWPVVAPDGPGGGFAGCDRHLALGSLARYLRPTLQSFAAQPAALLQADAGRAAAYRARLARPGRRLVGISWRSFQKQNRRHVQARKSAPLAAFRALEGDVDLLDLQYGDTAEERSRFREAGGSLLRLDELDLFGDLDGVMAAIEACDAIVSTSNVTAHLAGALGKPAVLVFLGRHPPYHYWMPDARGRSPWYPSVRILWAAHGDTWEGAVERAARMLEDTP